MKLRRKIVIAATAVLMLALMLGAYSTMAFLTTKETAHNVVTSGGVAITLLDKTRGEGQEDTALANLTDFTDAYPGGLAVLPGSSASKVVAVRKGTEDGPDNSAPCWVRVQLLQQVTTPNGPMPLEQYQDKITLELDTVNWTLDSEGWYRYNQPLTETDEVTTNLLDGVTFKGPDMGNEFKNSTYTITVRAQAVQAAHNADSVLAVQGWPS